MAFSLSNSAGKNPSIESIALELLSQHSEPMGASALQRILLNHGVKVGEATAGRLLRRLDHEGLTEKKGRLGRTLTVKGFRRLEMLRFEAYRTKTRQRFLSSIDTSSPTILLDVLIGRRAIERETARLAAKRATPEESRNLYALFMQHVRQKEAGKDAISENRELHLFIARMSKSHVLEAALDFILAETSVSQVLIKVRHEVGSRSGTEHPRIVDAILARDATAAEAAMVQHIDNIISDLYRVYGDELPDIQEVLTDTFLTPLNPDSQQV